MKYINISNSPCKECARDLIKAFKGKEKPAINFLWVHGAPGSDEDAQKVTEKQVRERTKKFASAWKGLDELVNAGFEVGLWNWTDFGNFLKKRAPTEKLRRILTNSIGKHPKRLKTRGKITKELIDEVIGNNAFFKESNKDDDEPEGGGGGGDGGGGDGGNHEGNDKKKNEGSQGGLLNFLSSILTTIIELTIDITVMGPHIISMTKLKFFVILATTACLGVLFGFVCRPFIPLQL